MARSFLSPVVSVALLVGCTSLASCTSLAGIDGEYVLGGQGGGGNQPTTGGTGGEGASGGEGGMPTGGSGAMGGGGGGMGGVGAGGGAACDGKPGPTMVDVGEFCIDSTEVTNAQYIDFLDAGVAAQDGETDCGFNTTYIPNGWPPALGAEDLPVGNLDWCDAKAYCEWAGKRLCGKIGGGPNDINDWDDPTLSEWMFACSADGSQFYSFGSGNEESSCNVEEVMVGDFAPVGTFEDCVGQNPPFDAIYDLSGNAHEWTDECDGVPGAGATCLVRGGSYGHLLSGASCDNDDQVGRSDLISDVSFRCCADL